MKTCNDIYQMYQSRNPEAEVHQAFREVNPDGADDQHDGRTPLHLACLFVDEGAVRILLGRGAQVNVKDGRGHTPLSTLARTRSYEEGRIASIAALLLGHGARVSRSAPDSTALIMAIEHGHYQMAAAIVDSGGRIDQTDGNGDNALHVACGVSGLSRRPRAEAPCAYDAERERLDLVRRLLASGQIDPEDKNGSGKTAWDIAIEEGAMRVAALLSGSDPDEDGRAAIHGNMDVFQALWTKNMPALAALLDAGVELQSACEHGDMYDFHGKSPLACALMWLEELPDAVEMILNAGADPNWRFPDENTALATWVARDCPSAYSGRCIRILRLMLSNGWDVGLPSDPEGNTPLHLACRHILMGPGKAAIPFLLESGADANAVNLYGQTPAMTLYGAHPARQGAEPYGWPVDGKEESNALEALLEAGADARREDIWGNTILHYIAAGCRETGARQAMELLTDYGLPDVGVAANDGRTAMDVAVEWDNETMVRLLMKHS